jgi:hypothetical protein
MGVGSAHRGLDGNARLALIIYHARLRPYLRCRQPHDRANPARKPSAARPCRVAGEDEHHSACEVPGSGSGGGTAVRLGVYEAQPIEGSAVRLEALLAA